MTKFLPKKSVELSQITFTLLADKEKSFKQKNGEIIRRIINANRDWITGYATDLEHFLNLLEKDEVLSYCQQKIAPDCPIRKFNTLHLNSLIRMIEELLPSNEDEEYFDTLNNWRIESLLNILIALNIQENWRIESLLNILIALNIQEKKIDYQIRQFLKLILNSRYKCTVEELFKIVAKKLV
ncbi:hypothetical protein [Microcoleus sp.]|uniref:hypothetical protein n=1 Tax=Microcoleus sp. TaxID=44472 RepID=UPI003523403B